jgi:phospholipid/cholesterol/gamma-HCH transport system substrate-binding protein
MREARALLHDLRTEVPSAPFQAAVQDLASILEKVDEGEGTLGAFINDPALYQRLKDLVGASPRTGYMRSILQDTVDATEKE